MSQGHRIGIETILLDYLDGMTPEEIVLRYPTLSLEQVYATITYYWHQQAVVDAYLRAYQAHGETMRAEQERHPSPLVRRRRELARARHAAVIVYLPLG